MVVKSVVNKSGLKVYIIQSIDRKMPLDDIADAKNLEMNELLKEIEAIVNSGTKINIDYYIDQVVDEDKQQEVFEYFRDEAETESIEEALDILGETDYSEEDIRLMRIKFLSELGN
jgi:ATP-dependent DNA helicase RecQ